MSLVDSQKFVSKFIDTVMQATDDRLKGHMICAQSADKEIEAFYALSSRWNVSQDEMYRLENEIRNGVRYDKEEKS